MLKLRSKPSRPVLYLYLGPQVLIIYMIILYAVFVQMLQQLKTLALEAETELERQDEALDELSCSADRNTMNINRHTRRMRKLL